MQETGEQAPWIGAGLVAGMVLAGAVILREVFLRIHEQRRIRERKMLDASLRSALPVWAEGVRRKVTFEQNREWLAFIEERSRAAKVLGHLPEAHREVFELCEDYLREISAELPNVSPSSPRFPAFVSGQRSAKQLHKYHVLRWAELESKQIVTDSRSRDIIGQGFEHIAKAERAVRYALDHYPQETELAESHDVFLQLLSLSDAIESAARASEQREMGNYYEALEFYRAALRIASEDVQETNESSKQLAERISAEIEELERMI